jgi:DNA-directed RNA polymerase subunit beta'
VRRRVAVDDEVAELDIEVIVRQMLQKVEITDGGDSEILTGDQIDRMELAEFNDLQALEVVDLAVDRRFGEDAGGLLERGRRDERAGLQTGAMIADIKSIARRRDGLIMAQKSAESGAAVAERRFGEDAGGLLERGRRDERAGLQRRLGDAEQDRDVIVGSLIPAGTGAMIADIKSIARRRDGLIMAQKSAESGA